MLLLSLDTETSGIDVNIDRVLEIGGVIYDTEAKSPIHLLSMLVKPDPDFKVAQETYEYTNISQQMLDTHAVTTSEALKSLNEMALLHKPDYIVGFNSRAFDWKILRNEYKRCGLLPQALEYPDLDIYEDVAWPAKYTCRKLGHLAMEHNVSVGFAHRAVFDSLTTLKLMECYPLEAIIARSKMPYVVVKAYVSFDQKDLAKKRRYSWEKISDRQFDKSWVKRIKESEVDQEAKEAGFRVEVIANG